MDYKEAGVDIDLGDQFVKNITHMVKSTFNTQVKNDLNSFAALYDMGSFYLSACTDGVGTKILLSMELDFHETIGQDLVAMSVNDLICNGSRPIFFLDYIACHKLELNKMQSLIHGISQACKQSNCALIGGETAEMNDLYDKNHYDLAGFAVGMVDKNKLINGSKVRSGSKLLAIKGDGFHANGFSLIRKLLNDNETDLMRQLLKPTPIYVPVIMNLLEAFPNDILGIANITGGGLNNIPRINSAFKYIIDSPYALNDLSKEMQIIINRAELSHQELYKTFNMGHGMVIAINENYKIDQFLDKLKIEYKYIGYVEEGSGIDY